ncbi:C1 family peptidase [Bacteriovorax sp. PP10]|uniref:C1 family peptidase n=1 Tax=Bacteriovorax antarcticus TaxID=3088717 RepID=A0ABU5VXE7_9BACT|nr:C1 family peptidase [Bacteriovorax sp. PP10]MEA9357023.1 C1 family peptidase [Bacteriovorax sp. PP10]
MKKLFVIIFAASSILTSCSQGKAPVNNSGYKDKIVLGNYVDMATYSTLDEALLKDLPATVDLSSDMSSVKNQDARGTCTFFSTLAMVEGAVKKDLGQDVNFSEEFLNYATKKAGYYPSEEGSNVGFNLRTISKDGLILERDWAYQSSWFGKALPCEKYKSTDSKAPAYCYSHDKPNKKAAANIINADGIEFSSLSKDTSKMIKFLAEEKRPLIMSVTVNFNGWPNSGETTYNEELRQECLSNPSDCGGHSILVTGYDMAKKVFFFKNSWGKEWGKNGYGTIPFEVVDRYVNDNLYYAEVKNPLKIPADANVDNLALMNFSAKTTLNEDQSINIYADGKVSETSGHMIYISSYLVKKSSQYATELPTDGNTITIQIIDEVEQKIAGDVMPRSLLYSIPAEQNELEIAALLHFPSAMLTVPSIAKLMGSQDYDTVTRTTIYVYTDDSSYKVLKRIYTPVK